MIFVTQPFLPPKEEYEKYITSIWESKWLTNQGPLVQQLENALQQYLNVPELKYVTNGTMSLQLAIKAFNLKGEIITTPFSFVATTTAITWEQCTPIYVDICPKTFCIDANKIEQAITNKTTAILATHVYGIPCNVEKIEEIARKNNLIVIYDAAHAFGVRYKRKSLVSYGDLSTLSFHATKLYHTIEGGAIINNRDFELTQKIDSLRNFGFQQGIPVSEGINAKNSEFHAAMGLCNLSYVEKIIYERKRLTLIYDDILLEFIERPYIPKDCDYNYAYYPIILKDEQELLKVEQALYKQKICTRRYFYPSLNTLSYINSNMKCDISENIASRILCLPLYVGLTEEQVREIAKIIKNVCNYEK